MLNKVKHAGREKSVSCDSGSWFAAVIMFADITVLRQWLSLSPFLSLCLSLFLQRQLVCSCNSNMLISQRQLVCSCNSNMFADITAAVGLQPSVT